MLLLIVKNTFFYGLPAVWPSSIRSLYEDWLKLGEKFKEFTICKKNGKNTKYRFQELACVSNIGISFFCIIIYKTKPPRILRMHCQLWSITMQCKRSEFLRTPLDVRHIEPFPFGHLIFVLFNIYCLCTLNVLYVKCTLLIMHCRSTGSTNWWNRMNVIFIEYWYFRKSSLSTNNTHFTLAYPLYVWLNLY